MFCGREVFGFFIDDLIFFEGFIVGCRVFDFKLFLVVLRFVN